MDESPDVPTIISTAVPTTVSPNVLIQVDEEIRRHMTLSTNISPDIIVTTGDKVRLTLMNYKEAVRAQLDWTVPFGLFATTLTTLISAEFKAALGLDPQVWKAVFVVVMAASFVWLVWSIVRAIRFRGHSEVNFVIQKIKDKPQ